MASLSHFPQPPTPQISKNKMNVTKTSSPPSKLSRLVPTHLGHHVFQRFSVSPSDRKVKPVYLPSLCIFMAGMTQISLDGFKCKLIPISSKPVWGWQVAFKQRFLTKYSA